jgi:hypothetical protein
VQPEHKVECPRSTNIRFDSLLRFGRTAASVPASPVLVLAAAGHKFHPCALQNYEEQARESFHYSAGKIETEPRTAIFEGQDLAQV